MIEKVVHLINLKCIGLRNAAEIELTREIFLMAVHLNKHDVLSQGRWFEILFVRMLLYSMTMHVLSVR